MYAENYAQFDSHNKSPKSESFGAKNNPVLQNISMLLRESSQVLQGIISGEKLLPMSQAMLISIALGGAVFGAAMGSYRGGLQILYAAIKLPLVLLFTAAIIAPALTSLNIALGRPAHLLKDLTLTLSALARSSMALAALSPLLLFAAKWEWDYHSTILLSVAACGIAGVLGVWHLAKGLLQSERQGFLWTIVVLGLVSATVGSQLSWSLRPFLLRPRSVEIPFIRSQEGNFLQAVQTSGQSAQGIYYRDMAPLSKASNKTSIEVQP